MKRILLIALSFCAPALLLLFSLISAESAVKSTGEARLYCWIAWAVFLSAAIVAALRLLRKDDA